VAAIRTNAFSLRVASSMEVEGTPPPSTPTPERSMEVEGILLDYSKNRITAETMQLLCALAEDAGVLPDYSQVHMLGLRYTFVKF